MKKTVRSLFAIAICALCVSTAQASLVQYNFGTGGGTLAGSGIDPLATATVISMGSGLKGANSGIDSTKGNPVDSFNFGKNDMADSSTLAASITASRYIQFTVTANTGYHLDLNGYTLTLQAFGHDAKEAFAVRSSVDSYASDLVNFGAGDTSWAPGTVNFSGSYDNLNSITFRIYGWSTGGKQDSWVDNINLNGTVVPEPVTYALAVAGLVFVGGGVGRFYLGRRRSATMN